MDSITTSLEMCKKLKEAGWPQDGTEFFWRTSVGLDAEIIWDKGHVGGWNKYFYAAPTAEEILRRLPKKIVQVPKFSYGDPEVLMLTANMTTNDLWYVRYLSSRIQQYGEADASLANAAAAMYCYLSENKLLPPL